MGLVLAVHSLIAAMDCIDAGDIALQAFEWLHAANKSASRTEFVCMVRHDPQVAVRDGLCGVQDRADTIRSLCIGNSAHQKMDHLTSLVTLLGFESVAVFGDCFDEVRLLPAA